MARNTEKPIQIDTGRANGAISQYRFVEQSGQDADIAQCTVRGQHAVGVSYDSGSDNELTPFVSDGTTLVEVGRTFTRNVNIATDASGKAIPATEGETVLGVSRSPGVVGRLATVDLNKRIDSLETTETTTTTTTTSTSSSTSSSSSTTTTTTAAG